MVHACLTAARLTDDLSWANQAWMCFEWFVGGNDLGVPLYHADTGGCQDGLQAHGPNKNQGAESSLAYLLSVLELHLYSERRRKHVQVEVAATLGYGIIGASKFADFCLEQYRDIDGLRPVSVWNRTTATAERLASNRGLQTYEHLEDLLRDPSIQMVHVAATPARHAEHALAALRAGKHVLCEKPIATNLGDAQAMVQAARERDRLLGINFVMRYGPLAEPVKSIINSGALGAPLRGYVVNRAGDNGLPIEHWFWDEKESGGIFVEHGVHFFDLVRSWLGEAKVLDAIRLRRPEADAIVDQVAADLRYSRQTSVNFYHGFHQSPHFDQQDFRLIFERGEMRLIGWVAQSIEIHALLQESEISLIEQSVPSITVSTLTQLGNEDRFVDRRHRRESVDREVLFTWDDTTDKQAVYGQALTKLMEDFINQIRNRHHEPRVTAADGIRSLELAIEADRIARNITS